MNEYHTIPIKSLYSHADSPIYMEIQRAHNNKTNLEKRNKVGWFTLPVFKIYCENTWIKIA